MIINNCEEKDVLDITREIRSIQAKTEGGLGTASENRWFRFIPGFLLKGFVKVANKNIHMGIRYGKIAITALGMNTGYPVWVIPHGSPTILLGVGSFVKRAVETEAGIEFQKHLCLTVSFDHDLIDGAPATRFIQELGDELRSCRNLRNISIEDGKQLESSSN